MGPHAKAGGLADVIGALPQELKRAGADPCVILPGYKPLLEKVAVETFADGLSVTLGAVRESLRILRAEGADGVPLYLIEHPGCFDRGGIYGDRGGDYPDNLQRFIFFGRAAAAAAERTRPDIIHAHDWHAAVAPIVIRADPSLAGRFASAVSVFTIHNLAFQGIFQTSDFPLLGIDWSRYSMDRLEFYRLVHLINGAHVATACTSTRNP